MGKKSHNKIDFNTQVRPIINSRCASCHGGVKRSGELNLLFREDALIGGESGHPSIIPGNAKESELIRRVVHHDIDERMPLEADPLPKEDIAILEQWINEGAAWDTHWAFIPPKALEVPQTLASWQKNGIDGFVAKRLKDQGLKPSKLANKKTLIRRLSLDLVGVPPTLEEIEAFVLDESEDAYEKLVDRLLASTRFGERWAAMWLDLARYGDSQGYQKDKHRVIWRYRDWVIRAFNEDMPFDRFTIEQLAGDLLEDPTDNQLIATAFHRNTMSNDEGGTDDEEFRVAAVIDRVNTTFEVWQGISIGCVQCHSHPYDPFDHREYYNLYAFFNNSRDADRSDDYPKLYSFNSQEEEEVETLRAWLESHNSPRGRKHPDFRKTYRKLSNTYLSASTPIMREFPKDSSRITRVFERGNWLVHGDTVGPNVPASLPAMKDDMPKNRLGLALWLVDPENPLTARVIVNRFWEQLFGIGLVETLEDFGSQGHKPSHPELLDFLANEFIQTHHWSVKSLLKQIVMSATYQQSPKVSLELAKEDPDNRLLARGSRVRLTAEQVRDQALAISGLLSDKMYGPSVMPPQPEGVWNVIRHVMRWTPSQGEDRYRRGLYTYWRRSSPYPSMITFDSPSREFCISRRISTNTPLQALVTLNDTVYLEASQALGKRMQDFKGQGKLAYGYELALGKKPSEAKEQALTEHFQKALDYYEHEPSAAKELLTLYKTEDPELAAYTVVANVLMNLDEFIMKE